MLNLQMPWNRIPEPSDSSSTATGHIGEVPAGLTDTVKEIRNHEPNAKGIHACQTKSINHDTNLDSHLCGQGGSIYWAGCTMLVSTISFIGL